MRKIALIVPLGRPDHLARTVLDGLLALVRDGVEIDVRVCQKYEFGFAVPGEFFIAEDDFIAFAREADLVCLFWGKDGTNFSLAEKIDACEKTAFFDGSEPGKNRRLNSEIMGGIMDGTYDGMGKIDKEMLSKCALYFRREKPYPEGTLPFPFGIESKHVRYTPETKKDIDIFCVFGQEEYPPLRREARELVEKFCKENNLSCVTRKLSPEEFPKQLARAKVGVSVSGGGYDTGRFWEILGNRALLLTEELDIEMPPGRKIDFESVVEWNGVDGLNKKLTELIPRFADGKPLVAEEEYGQILDNHSSKARVLDVWRAAQKKGIVSGELT